MTYLEQIEQVSVLGAGHWHVPDYVEPLKELPQVAVSLYGEDVERAASVAAQLPNARVCGSIPEALAGARFALIAGPHDRMAEYLAAVLEQRLPCVLEKPGCRRVDELAPLAQRAEALGAFVEIPFLLRSQSWLPLLERPDGPARMHLAFHAGPARRYVDWQCPWMLERQRAGGGVLMNLGTHLIDLALHLQPGLEFDAGCVSSARYGHSVEDWGGIRLLNRQTGDSAWLEADYGPEAVADLWTIEYVSPGQRWFATPAGAFDLTSPPPTEPAPVTMLSYDQVLEDALARFREGRPPLAGLDDLLAVLRMIEAAYAASRHGKPWSL